MDNFDNIIIIFYLLRNRHIQQKFKLYKIIFAMHINAPPKKIEIIYRIT